MRELKVVGLDVDGKRIICESDDPGEKFILRPDDRLRAAVRGDRSGASQTQSIPRFQTCCVPRRFRPGFARAHRSSRSPNRRASTYRRVERFAHPVLLERSRAAELATAAHPVLADGPAVLTLLETVTTALVARGLDPDATKWDAWRNEDGRWTVQLSWKAGRSDNVAHFRFTPGAHGGTVTAFDDAACELIDPDFARPLRPVAPVAQLAIEEPAPPAAGRRSTRTAQARPRPARPQGQAAGSGLGGRAARACAPAASANRASSASSASHAPATPTPSPSTNHRSTGVARHPHTVGARPPTATRLSPTASSG